MASPLAENGVGSTHTTSGVSSPHKFNGAINYLALGWCFHLQKCMYYVVYCGRGAQVKLWVSFACLQ